jgi:hypothetical protein
MLATPTLGGLSMSVAAGCATTVSATGVVAGWLQVLARKGAIRTLGVPDGLTLQVAQAGDADFPTKGPCASVRVKGLTLDGAQASSNFSAPCDQCRACLERAVQFKCGSPARLRVRVQASKPGGGFRASNWTASIDFTPSCAPEAATCFGK